ncbi:MAG TPA: dihydropteroate synthase [Pirellulaceae bacterium]|jgi:dihydropteroate synthase|nr:dihydropteroate synthase [Pirellulaceae bacterium]
MPSRSWTLRTRKLDLVGLPRLMGIVNVTPDSFSDGNAFFDAERAIEQALRLADEGADILDIGGESTRPYATPVEQAEEWRRVGRVVAEVCRRTTVPVSIDTYKSCVARAALDAGAEIVNDVTGLEGDPQMLDVVREYRPGVCAMHMRGTPQTMQDDPRYHDVVAEIHGYLQARFASLVAAGVPAETICLDPGIGFGKTHEHNFELVRSARRFLDLPAPILVGHSRKGFIAKAMASKERDRTAGTLGASLALAAAGIPILRVHDVQATRDALAVFAACGGLGAVTFGGQAT